MKHIDDMRRTAGISGLALAMLLQAQTVWGNCAEGNRYLDLARKSGGKQDFAQATKWLERSVEACDSYDAWHLMGVAQQKQRNLGDALDAYSEAVEHAPNRNSAAISVARYGQVLALNGQRYEALTMLERALDMHSNPPSWIREAAKEIDLNIVNQPISRESIKRSLSTQEFGILSSARLPNSAKSRSKKSETRIGIPINFKFDSIELDSLTQANLTQLGAVLAEPQYGDKSFTLIGHTDVRGAVDYNFTLSESRATAIHDALVSEYPALKGRLKVEGAGETTPKYSGTRISEEEHRLNRRLEVFVN